jgi:hypothetical protein
MTMLVDTALAPVSASGLRRDTGERPPSRHARRTEGAGAKACRSLGCDGYLVYGRRLDFPMEHFVIDGLAELSTLRDTGGYSAVSESFSGNRRTCRVAISL